MTVWHVDVPTDFQVQTLNGQPSENDVLRSSGDIGTPMSRLRFTGDCDYYTGAIHMTLAQFETFKTWWRDDVGKGSLPFDFPDPVTGDTREFTFTEIYRLTGMNADDQYIIQIAIVSESE